MPYSTLPAFWKYWVYYINPSTWFARGVLSATLPLVSVQCSSNEFARFDPPPGSTCGDYASSFVESVAMSGYLEDENATSNCGFCPYSTGAEYMQTLNVQASDKWPCAGYLIVYLIFNVFLVYFFTYTVRIKGWTFGFGVLTSGRDWLKSKLSRKHKDSQGDAEA